MRNVTNEFDGEEGTAPVEMLAQLFDAHGWPFRLLNEDELSGEVQGSWAAYQIRGIWRAEDRVLQLLSLPDLLVQESQRPAIYELVARANEQVWLGHFEFWSKGNVLLYRHGVLLADHGKLGLGQAQGLVDAAISECDRFYPAFQFVLWGGKSPQDALADALVDAAGEA
jgi:hypothetical protein